MTKSVVIMLGSIEGGDPVEILDRIKNIIGVLDAQLVYGKFDFVLKAELDCLPCIAKNIKQIQGICNVKTLFTEQMGKGEQK